MKPTLKILGKTSSINVRKVLWTCRELALPFDNEEWGAGYRSTAAPEFLALNPLGLVPVLVDGDFHVAESNTIIRYLCNAYDLQERLLPRDPRQRAGVERWMDLQASELNNAWRDAFMSLVRRHPDYQDARRVADGIANWSALMRVLDAQLDHTGAFINGPAFSLADVVMGLSVHRWFSTPFDHPPRPRLPAVQTYYDRLTARAGFREFGRNGAP